MCFSGWQISDDNFLFINLNTFTFWVLLFVLCGGRWVYGAGNLNIYNVNIALMESDHARDICPYSKYNDYYDLTMNLVLILTFKFIKLPLKMLSI